MSIAEIIIAILFGVFLFLLFLESLEGLNNRNRY